MSLQRAVGTPTPWYSQAAGTISSSPPLKREMANPKIAREGAKQADKSP